MRKKIDLLPLEHKAAISRQPHNEKEEVGCVQTNCEEANPFHLLRFSFILEWRVQVFAYGGSNKS